MEVIIEFVIETFLGALEQVIENKNLSKGKRYLLMFLLLSVIFSVIALLGFFGVILISSAKPHTNFGGVVIIIFDALFAIFMAALLIKKIRNIKSEN